MPKLDAMVLIPESTRKQRGGPAAKEVPDAILEVLPSPSRESLTSLRGEIEKGSPKGSVDPSGLLPAYLRYQGNMYRHIAIEAWEKRVPGVEVVIVSGLRGIVASRDPVPYYVHSMAEPMPPFGKLNRWWHEHGLPEILAAYLRAIRPANVVDLLSLEYREAVDGFGDALAGIPVRAIDFPGLGRASQPRRGERVTEILRSGRV